MTNIQKPDMRASFGQPTLNVGASTLLPVASHLNIYEVPTKYTEVLKTDSE